VVLSVYRNVECFFTRSLMLGIRAVECELLSASDESWNLPR